MAAPLLIVDPSIVWPEEEGVREIVGDWGGPVRIVRPGLEPSDVPGPGWSYDVAGVVVMGSRASVTEPRPWIRALGDWLLPIVRGEHPRPLLGICFGHQLVAHRSGSEVGYVHPDRSLERGVQQTSLHACALLPGRTDAHVVASHGEEVKSTPAGFRVAASRPCVPVDALEHETLPVFSVQFHPEARSGFLRARGVPESPREIEAFRDQSAMLESFRARLQR